jgi:hypothetical protein
VRDLAFVDARDFTALQLWWMEFAVTLICGFANVIGIAAGATLSERLIKFLVKNQRVITILANSVDIGVAVAPRTIYNALAQLFSSGFLLSLLKLIGEELKWWAIAWVAVKLLSLLAPGAQELVVAQMLVAFGVLAYRLTTLMMSYPGPTAQLSEAI